MSAELRRDLAEMQDAFEETNRDLLAMQQRFAALQADLTQACVERDWLLAEAPDELRERFFAVPRADSPRRPTPHLDRLRDGLTVAVAELRRLALANRRDACGLAQPYCFGPTRAAQAYERAAEIVEQALGGAS